MLLSNKSPDIGYPENEGIWWQGTFGLGYEKMKCTEGLYTSLTFIFTDISSSY